MKLVLSAAFGCLAMALFVISEWPWMLFGFFGLVPWLASLNHARSAGYALLAGCLMSVAYVFGVGYWIPSMIHAYTGMPWWVALLITLIGAPLIQPQFVAYALARFFAGQRRRIFLFPAAPLAAAFAFVATDWAFPKIFSDTLGENLLGALWLSQAADVVGALGLTFLVLLVNECLFAIWKARRPGLHEGPRGSLIAPCLALAFLFAVPTTYGALRYQQLSNQPEDQKPFSFVMVQAGFSNFGAMAQQYGDYLTVRTMLDTHIAMTRDAMAQQQTDLVIWPENVYPLSFGDPIHEEAKHLDDRIRALVAHTGATLVFGGLDREDEAWFNAAYVVQADGDGELLVSAYRKASLFPFVEYTPAWLSNGPLRAEADWLGTFSPGAEPEPFHLQLADQRLLKALPLICYDALHPGLVIRGVRQGAELLLTLSNDSWFDYGNTPRVILNNSAFRSIETRRPQLRTTVTGVSAVISATGEIIDDLESGQFGVLVGSIQPGHGQTLMLLWGDWFGPTSVVATFLIFLSARPRRQGLLTGPKRSSAKR